jgi:hypothetical protein
MADLPKEKPSKALIESSLASKLTVLAHMPPGLQEQTLDRYAQEAHPDGSEKERDEFKCYWRKRLDGEREHRALPTGDCATQGITKGAMPDNPFSDSEINDQIRVEILRLQAQSLEWDDNSAGRGFDDHIVETLVESLDAHAEAYLCKADRQDLISQYVKYMRNVGAALIHNAERRSFLSDPYSEDRLRKMAENSGEFILRKSSLTAVQQEAEIRDSVERIRLELRDEAVKWHQWHSQILSRVESRFEARFRRWEADAIELVKLGKGAGGWVRRLQKQLYPETEVNPWSKLLPVSRFSKTGEPNVSPTQRQPATLRPSKVNEGLKPQKWEDLEISFLSDERVQIISGGRTETRNYGELGFMDRRGGGKPNQGWGVLRALALARGTIHNSARNSKDFVAMGKRIERMRKTLMEHFGIASDPVPLDPVKGYCCRFKIGCASSFEK